jgi:hypothetical protein
LKLAFDTAGMKTGGKKIELVERDDKNDPAAAAAKDLLEKEHVDTIIGRRTRTSCWRSATSSICRRRSSSINAANKKYGYYYPGEGCTLPGVKK